jgi:hypothetical protein
MELEPSCVSSLLEPLDAALCDPAPLPSFICCWLHLLLIDPITLRCNKHLVCKPCALKWADVKQTDDLPCPLRCGVTTANIKQLPISEVVQHMINSDLKVRCPLDGCSFVADPLGPERRNMRKHLEQRCLRVVVLCGLGCGKGY